MPKKQKLEKLDVAGLIAKLQELPPDTLVDRFSMTLRGGEQVDIPEGAGQIEPYRDGIRMEGSPPEIVVNLLAEIEK